MSANEVVESVTLPEIVPDYIESRLQLWDKYKARYEAELAAKIPQKIDVEAADKNGEKRMIDGESWRSRPIDIAQKVLPKSWLDTLVIAKVNGVLWDLERPLEENCKLELLKFEDVQGEPKCYFFI